MICLLRYKTGARDCDQTHSALCLPIPTNYFNMSRFNILIVALLLAVVALMNNGADAQGRYYFSRNVMPTVVSYRQQQPRYPVVSRNTYNPYTPPVNNNNWARPLVSVPQQSFQPQYISRPANNYYYGNSGENNSGESREIYRSYW